ncbi:MAG: hypothetical protein M1831_004658 [Alyxoria varia]|nr:MAG: hypothetical protein M1831_004658 [Alyxoria varia]
MLLHRFARSIRASRSHISIHSNTTRAIPQRNPRIIASTAARPISSKTAADEKIEEIQDLYSGPLQYSVRLRLIQFRYATAKDELDIAAEETEKQTVYAEEDRKAAREELDRVQEAFKAVTEGPDRELAEQVKQRVGQRIRELDNAVKSVEDMAQNQD